MAKNLIGLVVLVALAVPVLAVAQATPRIPTVAQQRAYTLSLTCWVVASHYRIEADIHRTADAMRRTGAALGHNNERIARDGTAMASALGGELRSDPSSMLRHRASCRQIGLAS